MERFNLSTRKRQKGNKMKVVFEADNLSAVADQMVRFLREVGRIGVETKIVKAVEPEQTIVPAVEPVEHTPAGSHPKTYEAMRDAIRAIIGCDKDKLSRHKQILDAFEVNKISDIDVKDYPMYWAEVQKL